MGRLRITIVIVSERACYRLRSHEAEPEGEAKQALMLCDRGNWYGESKWPDQAGHASQRPIGILTGGKS